MSRKDEIIKSQSAARMLSTVSPIYDNSYIGLWTFEAIGIEYDELWAIIHAMPEQLDPATATWGLPLWEQRYNIQTDLNKSIEERRAAIASRRGKRQPINPALLEAMIEELTGRKVKVIEDNRNYRFVIQVEEGSAAVDYAAMVEKVNAAKPSHLSYEVSLPRNGRITIYFGTAMYVTKSITFTEYDRSGVIDVSWLVDELGNTLADETLNVFVDG